MFEIWMEEGGRLMRLRISGFWDAAIAARFADAVRAQSIAAVKATGSFDVLSDARDFAVQTPEVAARFTALAEQGAARRTAIVVTSALATMQARRGMASERVRIFSDMDRARAWLMAA